MYRIVACLLIVCVSNFQSAHGAEFIFGDRTRLGSPLNSSLSDFAHTSQDNLSLYVSRGHWNSAAKLYVSHRASESDPWGSLDILGDDLNRGGSVGIPTVSSDGLSVIFSDRTGRFGVFRSGGFGRGDIWLSERQSTDSPFGEPANIGAPINTKYIETDPSITADGLIMVFASDRPNGQGAPDLWESRRASIDAPWQEPVNLGADVNGAGEEYTPSLSSDGLALFYSRGIIGGENPDIWGVTRKDIDSPWGSPVDLGSEVNSSRTDIGPQISADGSTLFVSSWTNPNQLDIYSIPIGVYSPRGINGGGETIVEDFNSMGTDTGFDLPVGWSANIAGDVTHDVSSLGLVDGVLSSSPGTLNLGGNAEHFSSSVDRLPVWKADLNDDGLTDDLDVIADGATDRALGIARAGEGDDGSLVMEIEIVGNPLRAFSLMWDLEIWGGDPDATYRGSDGGGFEVDIAVGLRGTSYYNAIESLNPGELFDTPFDQGSSGYDTTLIDGNKYRRVDLASGIIEVKKSTDGKVGNPLKLTFDANFGDHDAGWISAIDNVRLRALAPGDADANGVVEVADLLQLLGGQKFNKGVQDVTWEEGDFNADDQFNTSDLLAMLSFLKGTFPSDPYASEAGASSDAVADVIVNSETGEVTVDLAGHTVSAIIIESAAEIFSGVQPNWDSTSQFPSTLPGELGNVLFTSTASGVDELGVVISSDFLGRDKEFYLADLDLSILIASDGSGLAKGNVIVVPEPSTWLLFGIGSLAIIAVLRRRLVG